MEHDLMAAKLREFQSVLDQHRRLTETLHRYEEDPQWRAADDAVRRLLPVIEQIAERISETLLALLRTTSPEPWRWVHAHEATVQLLGVVEQQAEVDRMLGPRGPQLAADRFHPWIWEASSQLWTDGYRREALQAAATVLELRLRAKLGRADLSGTDLVTKAFSLTRRQGEPRLRLTESDSEDTHRSLHEGVQQFGRGCFLAIRNIATHTLVQPEETAAIEALAALSLLARWIDEARVAE